MIVTGDISAAQVEVFRSAVNEAADELCLRVRLCIEEGLGVDDLVAL